MAMESAPPVHSPKWSAQAAQAIQAALVAACLLGWGSSFTQAEIPSGPTDISRYQKIWDISPFVAVTDLSGQADDMAGRFAVTGFARLGEKDVVFVFDRTTLERFSLTPGESRAGVSLQSLNHQGDLRSVRATLATGGRTLDISYDPSIMPDSTSGQPVIPGQMHAQQAHRGFPGQPQPHVQPGQPGIPPGAQTQQMQNPNAIIGAPPPSAVPTQEVPPPRRVIRRRAIVAPE